MLHFHSLQVKKITKETEDCVTISFHVPEALKDTFCFVQGQNLTVRKEIDGREIRRNYSLCSSPLDKEWTIAVKKTPGGVFSAFANESLKAGDFLDVLPPTGNFYTKLHPEQQKNYLAFAAGSGITPILSIIKTTLLTEARSSFTLVYGNRTKNTILFREDLESLKDKFMDRFRVVHVFSREITDATVNSGRLDKEKCALLCSKLIDVRMMHEVFICGPEQMIFCIRDFLTEKGLPKEHIHFELFTVPGQQQLVMNNQQSAMKQSSKAAVTVKLDGISFTFGLGYDEESILDAALRQGADLPYACKGGVCTTCKAKLIKGEVAMDRNWGLADEEVAEGFVLSCQSHPRTPEVFIDYDAR